MIAPETTDNSSTAAVNGSPVAVTPGLTVASAVADAVITSMHSDGARVRVEVPQVGAAR